MFLGAHPNATSLGEVNLIGKALRLQQRCTCGALISECKAWVDVFRIIQEAHGKDFLTDPYSFQLWPSRARVLVDRTHQNEKFEAAFKVRQAWLMARSLLPPSLKKIVPIPAVLKLSVRNKLQLYEAISRSWGCELIVDSSKNPWEAVELAKIAGDQVKVILLTRDGRGVYHSRRSSGFSRVESVGGWRKYYSRALPMLHAELGPESLIQLRYEDFAADPEATGQCLCDWLGIGFAESMLSISSAVRHMVNGNDTRFTPQSGIKLDERWRRELSLPELAYFERNAGHLNLQLGYNA